MSVLLELESSLAEQPGLAKQIQLMLLNLADDISDGVAFSGSVSKSEISELLGPSLDLDVALVCPKCNNFIFSLDSDAKDGILDENILPCCRDHYKQYHLLSRTSLEYWHCFLNDPFGTVQKMPNFTRFLFYSTEGIPALLRPRVWGVLLGCCDSAGAVGNDWCEALFAGLCADTLPYHRVIANDMNRVFPGLSYFDAKGQESLRKILCAYLLYDSDIGYCQGLSFLVGLLLFHFKLAPMTFLATINIFEQRRNQSFGKIFDKQMSGLELWFFQFERILQKHNPQLSAHFASIKVDVRLFTAKWFLSFFAVGCPMQILIKLFDIMIIEGFQLLIFKILLVILAKHTPGLLALKDAEAIHLLLLLPGIWDVYERNLGAIVADLLALDPELVSQDFLTELSAKFDVEVPKKMLSVNVTRANELKPEPEENLFMRFLRYGFLNPSTAAPTPVVEQTPIAPRPEPASIDTLVSDSESSRLDLFDSAESASLGLLTKSPLEKPVVQVEKPGAHQRGVSVCSALTEASLMLLPPSEHVFGRRLHQRGHSYSPSIGSVSLKTRLEMREMEMAAELESMKYKIETYERVMADDLKLIKSLFRLYLMKDDVDEAEGVEREQLEEKLKRRELKVLQEVEERLRR